MEYESRFDRSECSLRAPSNRPACFARFPAQAPTEWNSTVGSTQTLSAPLITVARPHGARRMVTCKSNLTRRNSMHKLITLLVALLMITANALAAVNVNTANEAELQMLTGIGPAKAKAIIDYRTKNGAFKSVDDLTKVPGIGPAVLGKMKNDVTLSGLTTAKTPAQAAAPANEPAKPSPAASSSPAPVPTATAATPAPAGATKAPAAPATVPVSAAKAEPGKATPLASPTAA
ncbi:helix-hairpin-helix domain-containing protein, partial [Accumulibacter sp.]|uniref:ComEA family DNA-binding protein n=1 Tax=Accumulibacter sp. TaxID=2053492 RepID=UPI002C1C36CD